jgi:cell division protein FtsN
MPKTSDGELELVLGNKQLLSVFFVVVVLLGIFFAMGYVVGRNSAAGPAPAATQPQVEVPESGTTPARAAVAAVPPELEEVRTETGSKAAAKEIPAAPIPSTGAARPLPAGPEPARKAPAAAAEAEPGKVYLQVAATTRSEAELLKEQLAKKGYSVVLGPVPGQDLLRVLVGPFSDQDSLARTRTALQQMGLKPFTRRL